MRILAPRKRDSVTGEEVVLSLTNAVVASRSTTGSNNNISTTCNCTESLIEEGTTTTGCYPSSHEKLLFNGFGSPNDCVLHVLSPLLSSLTHNEKQVVPVVQVDNKQTEKATSKLQTSSNWRNRIGNSVTELLFAFNGNCCAVAHHQQQEIYQKNGSESVEDEKYLKAVVKCESKAVVTVNEERLLGESQQGALKKEKANSAITTSSTVVITSEGSLSTLNSEKFSSSLPGDTSESIHEATTTSTARDKPVAAAVKTNIKIMRTEIYHEKQVKSLCALHALNNLLQDGKAFKQEDLDKICSELDPNSWVNPHKSVFGLGNYDINVIMTALQQKKLEAVWFDKRKDPSEELNFDNIYGFILNIPSDCRLGWLALPIKRKHWVAIRNMPSATERDAGRSNYYNLDSKFDKPESIGSTENLIEYLRGELRSPEKELFLVVTEDVGRLETWRKNPPPPPSSTSVSGMTAESAAASGSSTHFLPVPTTSGESGADAAAGSGNNRRTSNDSGVVDLLPDLRDINVVDLNKEDLMRRQSSGVWSDLT